MATSTPASNAGVSKLFVDLTQGSYARGAWTVNVRGMQGAQDQDVIMGILVSVAVHQLAEQTRVSPALPAFTPTGSTTFFLSPGAAGPATSPDGCNLQAGAPDAGLSTTAPAGTCQGGSMGYAINYGAGVPGTFTSAPLAAPLTIGGNTSLRFYLADPAQPAWNAAQNPRLGLEIDAVDENGELLLAVGAAEWTVCNTVNGVRVCNSGPAATGGTYVVSIPPVTLPAGSRSRSSCARRASSPPPRAPCTAARASASYADAGITFTTGTLQ